jgi:cyclic beta-1,2-glucan synthetase
MMGLMVEPERPAPTCSAWPRLGFMGKHGFYEAIDYTASRLPRGQDFAVVRSFMAHHQGMGFLALSYLLHDRPMQRRFESDPQFQATLLLLQERVPKTGAFESGTHRAGRDARAAPEAAMPMRILTQPTANQPEVQLLSNGRYHVMVTAAGGGYSRWKDLAVTRWREDTTVADDWGNFCYVRDLDSGRSGPPPAADPGRARTNTKPSSPKAAPNSVGATTASICTPKSWCRRRTISSCAAPASPTNRACSRTIEFTSYAEVVMAPPRPTRPTRPSEAVRADRDPAQAKTRSCAPAVRAPRTSRCPGC